MIRSVWLAFAFLVFIGALAAFKVGVAMPPGQQVAVADEATESEAVQGALPKSDKLDDVPDRIPVQPIAIVPPQATPQAEEKPIRIVSRHWRDSNAKMKKRKHHRHHATRTKKHRAHRR
jgi:hypothetical protein